MSESFANIQKMLSTKDIYPNWKLAHSHHYIKGEWTNGQTSRVEVFKEICLLIPAV